MLRRFLARLTSDSKPGRGNAPQWVAKNQHITNNMNEIQLLTGHTDIVRSLVRIDASRFASSSDDCTIIIWGIDTGEALMRLTGHTSTITCMLLVSRNTLISGSADRSMIAYIWDLTTGSASKVIPDCHNGSVKCLLRLDSTSFMSAGNDKHLNIWKTSGELIDLIERNEQENLNCVLMISNKRVITAGNSAEMVVYSLVEKRCVSLLVAHREPVRCLINLNSSMFVSASLDGQIVVWSSTTLTALHEFNFHKTYINSDHVYIYNVHQLAKLSDQYLAACIGSGYAVYKISEKSAECVMECLNAHSATVLSIAPLYYGTALVTSSADTTIRLWGSKIEFQFRPPPAPKSSPTGSSNHPNAQQPTGKGSSTPKGKSSNSGGDGSKITNVNDPRFDIKYVPPEKTIERNSVSSFLTSTLLDSDKPNVGIYPPRLIGDVCCHSDQVNIILPLSPFAFASASSDGGIVIWRDGRVQSAIRGELSIVSLRQWHTKHIEMSILEATTSHYASTEAKYSLSGSESSLPAHQQQQQQQQQQYHLQAQQQQQYHLGNMSRSPSADFVVFDSHSSNPSPNSSTPHMPHNLSLPSPTSTRGNISPLHSMESITNLLSNPGNVASPRSPREHQRAISTGSGTSPSKFGQQQHPIQTTSVSTSSIPSLGVYVPRTHIKVPPYIADNAYYLFYELNYSLEQVREALLADGNSEAIVVAAISELQQ